VPKNDLPPAFRDPLVKGDKQPPFSLAANGGAERYKKRPLYLIKAARVFLLLQELDEVFLPRHNDL
jgi:hypothetical protein